MKKIVFLTPPDARYGFSLTGVEQQVLQPSEATEAMLKATGDPTAGAVVIDERLIDAATRQLLPQLERGWTGIAVVLPAPEKAAGAAEDYAAQLIRRAIGYQVRLSP